MVFRQVIERGDRRRVRGERGSCELLGEALKTLNGYVDLGWPNLVVGHRSDIVNRKRNMQKGHVRKIPLQACIKEIGRHRPVVAVKT
jgi:hypothetical protein